MASESSTSSSSSNTSSTIIANNIINNNNNSINNNSNAILRPQQIELEKKGWLQKWTNYLKGYQKRYFVLSNGTLSYYRNPLEISQSCRGSIQLETAVIHSDDSFNFYIMGPMAATYHLKAASEVERQEWVAALELAKVRAIRQIDADEDDMLDLNTATDKNEMGAMIKELQIKLDQLSGYGEAAHKNAVTLQRALSELETTTSPEEVIAKIAAINERATVFRVTSSALVNASADYLVHCKSHCSKLQKLMKHEHESRMKLEILVEQLATQHSNLEQRAIKQQQSNNAANSSTSSVVGDNIDDDEFYDAIEMPPPDLVTITFPGKAHRVTSSISEQNTSQADNVDNNTEQSSAEISSQTKRNHRRNKSNSFNDSSNEDGDDDSYWSEVDVVTHKNSASDNKELNNKKEECLKQQSSSVKANGVIKRAVRRRRTSIPVRPNHSLNLWSFMKNCIGKELTKIPMPVNFNEPLSMLQRMTEEFEYASLLHKAATCTDPVEQLVYVAAFSATCYATTANRTNKPFNPLLGETYECDRTDDLGWRCISEQVSHHPPMLAQHCESDSWSCWREFTMTSKFRGKYLSVTPIDITHLEFANSLNHYTWRKVTTTVHNIIVGKLWVDNHGEMRIVNHHTGDTCLLNLHPYSYFSRDIPRRINGVIYNSANDIKWVITGTWDNKIEAARVISSRMTKNSSKPTVETETPMLIWKRVVPPPEFERMYNMTLLAVQLNEPEEGVAPTDSRLRPDQRLMEETKWDEANELKVKLEEKQRAVRRAREEEAERAAAEGKPYVPYEPSWFKTIKDPITGNPVHVYKQDYWQCKKIQDWSRCPKIYLEDEEMENKD